MGQTIRVAADRAKDQTKTVYPAEVARGIYMENAPSLAALKLLHILIAKAGAGIGEDVTHQIRLSEIRHLDGMRHHDRASLKPLFIELGGAVLVADKADGGWSITGLLDEADTEMRDETSGDLLILWRFRRAFIAMAAASEHWALIDRQLALRLRSRYSMLLFQHVSSLVNLAHVSSRIFSVPELRAVLAIEPGKLPRFAEVNKHALQPAIAEISEASRFTLEAKLHKTGRTVTGVEIAWTAKPDPLRRPPRLVAAAAAAPDAVTRAPARTPASTPASTPAGFPATGSIAYAPRWLDLKRAAGCNMDNGRIAADFRRFCAGRGISLEAAGIEQIFASYCAKVGKV